MPPDASAKRPSNRSGEPIYQGQHALLLRLCVSIAESLLTIQPRDAEVVEPINNLTVGLDFGSINLKQAIDTLSQDEVFADRVKYALTCHRTPSCDLATDGSQCPNPLTCGDVDLRTRMLGGTNTNGIDISTLYRMRTECRQLQLPVEQQLRAQV